MVRQNPTSGLKGVICFTLELIRALRAVHTRLVHGRFYMMIIPLQRPSVEVFDSNGDLFSRKSFNTVEPQTHEPLEVDIRTDHTADDDNEVLYISDNVQIDIAEDTDTLETPQSEQSSSGSETSSVALLLRQQHPPNLHYAGNCFLQSFEPYT